MSKGPSKFAEKCCVFHPPGYRTKKGDLEMISSYWEFSGFIPNLSDKSYFVAQFGLCGISFTSRKGWGKLVLK